MSRIHLAARRSPPRLPPATSLTLSTTLATFTRLVLSAAALANLSTLAPPIHLAAQPGGRPYPAAAHGGNYMHNFYFPPAPSSSPWYPAWHPGGERVAVAMSGSLWEVDIATGDAHEIVHGPDYYSSPNYSPDGAWVLYTADDGGSTIHLEVMNTATGERHRLTEGAHIHTDPRFSPTGDRIAYVSTAPSGYFNVYIRPFADGDWAGPEIAVTSDNSFGRNRLYFGPWDMHISPAWLPTGEELLIVSNRDVALGSGNVYRVPARAGGIEERQTVLAEQTLYRTQPHVSYDGRRFVYSSTAGAADQFQNLYVQPTSGGEPYKMTFFDFDAFHPRWSPDAEWIAFVANGGGATHTDGLPRLHLLEANGGALRRIDITERHWARPTGTLSVRTTGADGTLLASRIHLTTSDGKSYAPADAYARVARAGDRIFHHPGSFTVGLPAGTAELTVVRGFETTPRTVQAQVRDGEVTELTITLEEISDVSDQGWFSGSTHLHMNYAGNLRNSLENLMMMSAAEDQDIVNEQIANKDNRILDHQFWIPGGGPHPLSEPDRVLVVGQEYRPPFYGHVFMFGHRDHLIAPYAMGYEGTAIESLYPSNTDMLLKAKAQGATTAYVHSFYNGDPLEGNLGGAKGFIVDAALGAADAVEWSTPQDGWPPLYAVWSNGIRAALVGGEDAISSLHATPLVGSMRTYVRTPDGRLTMEGWFQGLRDGRAYMSSGPLVEFAVEGRGPGEDLALDAPGEVRVSGRVWGIVGMEMAELVVNGEVVRTYIFDGDRKSLEIDDRIALAGSAWVHLRVTGLREDRWPLDTSYPQAATNPVWVTVGGRPIRSAVAAAYALRWIDRLQEMAEEWPGWRSEREKEHVYAQFEEAREVYRRRGAEAVDAVTLEVRAPGERPRGLAPALQPTVTEQSSGTTEVLQAISPVSEETVWVSGHGGVILRSIDGGSSWDRVAAPGGDSLQFRDIHAFSSRAAVALTSGDGPMSRIYRTADGGGSWSLAFLMDDPAGFVSCLDFWDGDRGFAFGDTFDGSPYVLVTRDGGRSWSRVEAGALPAGNEGEGGFAASGTCARTGAGGHGWIGTGAGGSARILATSDYGESWTATEVPMARGDMAGIFTLAVDGGWPVMALGGDLGSREAVVERNAAVSADGGESWTAAAAAPIEGSVYGSAVGGRTWYRVVVAVAPTGAAFSDDMGATWEAIPDVSAWAVEFADGGRVGWAAGGGGRVWRIEW
ncbi:MAG: CehA/McbA family metallohydrolase [Gemmatimonadota bacterium]|nr:CehA/McbA family metallohydrolase [Gemmatimonadota bacterium]